MTWTCAIEAVFFKDGMGQATVTFKSDDPDRQPITQTNFGDTLDKAALNDWCYNKLRSLNASEAAFADLKTVQIGPIVPTKPVSLPPP